MGGAAGLAAYLLLRPAPSARKAKQTAPSALTRADVALQAFVVAWIFGRLGCAVVHDHPGARTSFFLGVRFADGVRHDLGLDEFLFTVLVLFPLIPILPRSRFGKVPGIHLLAVIALYAPARFALDFLRVTDTRESLKVA